MTSHHLPGFEDAKIIYETICEIPAVLCKVPKQHRITPESQMARERNSMELVPEHKINGDTVPEHFQNGLRLSVGEDAMYIVNRHFYGISQSDFGKQVVCNVKVVKRTKPAYINDAGVEVPERSFILLDFRKCPDDTRAQYKMSLMKLFRNEQILESDVRICSGRYLRFTTIKYFDYVCHNCGKAIRLMRPHPLGESSKILCKECRPKAVAKEDDSALTQRMRHVFKVRLEKLAGKATSDQ